MQRKSRRKTSKEMRRRDSRTKTNNGKAKDLVREDRLLIKYRKTSKNSHEPIIDIV